MKGENIKSLRASYWETSTRPKLSSRLGDIEVISLVQGINDDLTITDALNFDHIASIDDEHFRSSCMRFSSTGMDKAGRPVDLPAQKAKALFLKKFFRGFWAVPDQ